MRATSFAKRFCEILKLRDMTAADLSRRTGISEAVLSQYKSGRYEPKQDRVELFAEILNVSVQWIMGYDVPMGTYQNEPDPDPAERFAALFSQLSAEHQNIIIAQIKGILATYDKKDSGKDSE